MDITENQRQWILDHLGHTFDVHRMHYRQTSDLIERVQISKLLLIQDFGMVNKFVGKKLDDIQLEGNILNELVKSQNMLGVHSDISSVNI